jgi:hypothetical protein
MEQSRHVLWAQFLGLVLLLSAPARSQPPGRAVQRVAGRDWTTVQSAKAEAGTVIRGLMRPYPGPKTNVAAEVSVAVATPEAARAVADAFVAELAGRLVAPLLGASALAPTEALVVNDVVTTQNRPPWAHRGRHYTVVYGQRHGGVPVLGASLRVRVTRDGEIWSVINRLCEVNGRLTAKPLLTAEDALAHCRDVLAAPDAQPLEAPVLWVHAPSHLVWRLDFSTPHFLEFRIDALTGKVVLKRKNVRD